MEPLLLYKANTHCTSSHFSIVVALYISRAPPSHTARSNPIFFFFEHAAIQMIWEFWGLRIQLKASARLSFLKKIHVSTCVKFILVQVLYIHLPAAGHLSTANYSGERERESSNNGMVWEGQLFLDVDLSWHMAAVHVEEGHACNACSCTCTQRSPLWRTNTQRPGNSRSYSDIRTTSPLLYLTHWKHGISYACLHFISGGDCIVVSTPHKHTHTFIHCSYSVPMHVAYTLQLQCHLHRRAVSIHSYCKS